MRQRSVAGFFLLGRRFFLRGRLLFSRLRNRHFLQRVLQDFVKTRLSRHEYPRRVAFVTELPRTPAGKLNRRALRDENRARSQEGLDE